MLIAKISYLFAKYKPVYPLWRDFTYASVKKPTPATRATLAWNRLKANWLEMLNMRWGTLVHLRKFSTIDFCQGGATTLVQNISDIIFWFLRIGLMGRSHLVLWCGHWALWLTWSTGERRRLDRGWLEQHPHDTLPFKLWRRCQFRITCLRLDIHPGRQHPSWWDNTIGTLHVRWYSQSGSTFRCLKRKKSADKCDLSEPRCLSTSSTFSKSKRF